MGMKTTGEAGSKARFEFRYDKHSQKRDTGLGYGEGIGFGRANRDGIEHTKWRREIILLPSTWFIDL